MKPRIEDIDVKEEYSRDEIISLFEKMCGSLNMEYVLDSQSLFKWKKVQGDYLIKDANGITFIVSAHTWYVSGRVIHLAENSMLHLFLWVGENEI